MSDGILSGVVDAIKRKIAPSPDSPTGSGGAEREKAIMDQVDAVSGAEGNHSSTVPSHAGIPAQSTDHYNKY